jgi:signal transduction histidine kinase
VKLAISDTGIGISEEGRRRLFSEFFREKRSENRYVTGTGLGLSIVKRLLDFYHGRIQVASTLGEGTTFTLWLPCKFQSAPAPAEAAG